MLHEVFGDYGAGKSAFLTYQIKNLYLNHGDEKLAFSKNMIAEINATRKKKLSYPKKPPIFANFDVTIKEKDGTVFKPYRIDGSKIGLNSLDSESDYKFFPPGSAIFIDEAQNYFNSKGDLKREVSAFFEKHRHNYLDIWLATQRGILINKDIRGICQDFKQIITLENDYSIFGNVTKTRWHVLEFTDRYNFEKYLATDGGEGFSDENKKTYVNEGNIFDCYNSHSYMPDFIPPEGKNF
ncbi:MAG: zonular occludens toxin domain-containing protein [Candidatus Coproplasma sp.]